MEADIYPGLPTITVEGDNGIIHVLPEATVRALTSIALRRGIGYGNALVQAIADENFIGEETGNGGNLLLEKPDGRIRYLERSPYPSQFL